jgi:hypothetical protein
MSAFEGCFNFIRDSLVTQGKPSKYVSVAFDLPTLFGEELPNLGL